MQTYTCKNKKCSTYNTPVEVSVIHKRYTSYGILDMNAQCPECGQMRDSEGLKDGYCTTVIGRKNVPRK